MCQVSGRLREAGAVDVGVDVAGDGLEGGPELGWRLGLVCGDERDYEPVVELGIEDGDADALGGEHVAVGVLDAADEAVEAQASQVVGHLPVAVGGAEQTANQGAQALVGEAGGRQQGGAQGADQGHDPRIAEPKCRVLRPAVSTVGCAIRSKAGLASTQPWPTRSASRMRRLHARALVWSSSRLCSRALQPRSRGALTTVSMRIARPSLRYCLIRECL